jgi:hypothetical protein
LVAADLDEAGVEFVPEALELGGEFRRSSFAALVTEEAPARVACVAVRPTGARSSNFTIVAPFTRVETVGALSRRANCDDTGPAAGPLPPPGGRGGRGLGAVGGDDRILPMTDSTYRSMPSMNSGSAPSPFAMRWSRASHAPVIAALFTSGSTTAMSVMPFSVATSVFPSRTMYARVSSVSMMFARVAGVPSPFSFIASDSSRSSSVFPAVSIAVSSVADLDASKLYQNLSTILPVQAASGDLNIYAAAVLRSTTPTFTNATDLVFTFGCEQD